MITYCLILFCLLLNIPMSFLYRRYFCVQNKLPTKMEGEIILQNGPEKDAHSVIFLNEMQTKFYCQNIGIIVIFNEKMFRPHDRV